MGEGVIIRFSEQVQDMMLELRGMAPEFIRVEYQSKYGTDYPWIREELSISIYGVIIYGMITNAFEDGSYELGLRTEKASVV